MTSGIAQERSCGDPAPPAKHPAVLGLGHASRGAMQVKEKQIQCSHFTARKAVCTHEDAGVCIAAISTSGDLRCRDFT